MKALSAFLVISALALGAACALAQRTPDRPPGIGADSWVPINENLGIVLVPQSANGGGPPVVIPSQPLLLGVPANGYFMVRRADRWVRLVVVEPLRGAGDAG
jgi:hypothetical protein